MKEQTLKSLAVGVDVGGTKISAGLVDETGQLHDIVEISTPAAQAVEEAVIRLVAGLSSRVVVPVGVSVAGFVDRDGAGLKFAPNIPGWINPTLRESLSTRLGCPVTVENDANAAAWGEAVFGAGGNAADLICLTVGTGLGGGLVLGGTLQRGASGFAAEYGHMILIPNGRPCTCGQFGCWERYVSGGALVWEATRLATEEPRAGTSLMHSSASNPGMLTGPDVMRAAELGDIAALGAYGIVGAYLGQGLAQLVTILDPARFIIGGGVSQANDLLFDPARAALGMALSAQPYRPIPTIEGAQLGVRAGIIGVADLARRTARVGVPY